MPVLLLFAAVAIGLADRPASADVPEEAPVTMIQTSLDLGATCSTAPEVESFEAGQEMEENDCALECVHNYVLCRATFPDSFCGPRYEHCASLC